MNGKKILLSILAGLFCFGIFSGCGSRPWDFQSTEEAQTYVLRRLKHKYHETFVFTEEPRYKEEKIGIHWISGKIAPKDTPEKTATVYARNTAKFNDTYHIYYFSEQIEELVYPFFSDKDYIKEIKIEVKGRGSNTEWTGKESIEKYLEKGEYQIIADIYLNENLTDAEYAQQIALLIDAISDCGLHIQMDVWDKPDEWIFRAFPDDGKIAKDQESIVDKIISHRSLRESMEDYEKWKQKNQTVQE